MVNIGLILAAGLSNRNFYVETFDELTSSGEHFQGLTPVIDDFLGKSSKLAASLRSTVLALSSFLDRCYGNNIFDFRGTVKGRFRTLRGGALHS